MKFYKNCESLSFFISTYVVFLIEILYVYYINDDICTEKNQVLITHKEIFAFLFFMTICSHFFTSFIDPGIINKSNSKVLLEYYSLINKEINKTKQKYEKFNLLEKDDDLSDEENELSEDENSPNTISNLNDTSRIEIMNNLDNGKKKKKIVSKKYGFEVTRCNTCFVLRPKGAHHCSDCQCCVLDRDNHCPWMNNCVGLYNRKIYILFCLYSIISVAYAFCIYFYYVVIKNFPTFRKSFKRSMQGIFLLFISFVYGGFCLTLMGDERKNVIKEFKSYGDEKERLMKLRMRIIFGGKFSPKWFLPCFKGGKGYYDPSMASKNKKDNIRKIKKKFKNVSQTSFD